jgi:hypothetical protein
MLVPAAQGVQAHPLPVLRVIVSAQIHLAVRHTSWRLHDAHL